MDRTIRQFWGKLIRHFSKVSRLQIVIWGGSFNPNLSNKITFFHNALRIE